jgi:hypothetical protein
VLPKTYGMGGYRDQSGGITAGLPALGRNPKIATNDERHEPVAKPSPQNLRHACDESHRTQCHGGDDAFEGLLRRRSPDLSASFVGSFRSGDRDEFPLDFSDGIPAILVGKSGVRGLRSTQQAASIRTRRPVWPRSSDVVCNVKARYRGVR